MKELSWIVAWGMMLVIPVLVSRPSVAQQTAGMEVGVMGGGLVLGESPLPLGHTFLRFRAAPGLYVQADVDGSTHIQGVNPPRLVGMALRTLWRPFASGSRGPVVSPYVSAGSGMLLYRQDADVPPRPSRLVDQGPRPAREQGWAVTFPVHMGLSIRLTRSLSLDLEGGITAVTSGSTGYFAANHSGRLLSFGFGLVFNDSAPVPRPVPAVSPQPPLMAEQASGEPEPGPLTPPVSEAPPAEKDEVEVEEVVAEGMRTEAEPAVAVPVADQAEPGEPAPAPAIVPVAEPEPAEAPEQAPPRAGGWVLVVLSTPSEAEAEAVAPRYAGLAHPVEVLPAVVNGRPRYRLVLGPFPDLAALRAAQANMAGRLPADAWALRLDPAP